MGHNEEPYRRECTRAYRQYTLSPRPTRNGIRHKDVPRFQAVRRLLSLLQLPPFAEAQDNPIDRRQ